MVLVYPRSCSPFLWNAAPKKPKPPAFATAAARAGPDTPAMGAPIKGICSPNRSVKRFLMVAMFPAQQDVQLCALPP